MRKTNPFFHKKTDIFVNLIIGILLIGLFSPGLLRNCSALIRGDGEAYLIPVLGSGFMVLVGISFLASANDIRKKYKYYSVYPKVLSSDGVISVEKVASLMNRTPDVVRCDVEKMYVYGYIKQAFPNEQGSAYTVYIDNTGIEMNGTVPKTYKEINEEKQKEKMAKKEELARVKAENKERKKPVAHKESNYVTVTCKACGGITAIPHNSVGVCDYCGSKIKS